jgi:hypothetical protein
MRGAVIVDLKDIPAMAPWLAGLPLLPKIIISVVVVAFAAFVLALIWTKAAPDDATQAILSGCYRRALFTKMHAQLSLKDMFDSIAECRKVLQTNIPKMKRTNEQDIAIQLLANVETIERLNPPSYEDFAKINALKLQALHNFRNLANLSGAAFPLPDIGKLGESVYFTKQEADAPLTEQDITSGNQVAANTLH